MATAKKVSKADKIRAYQAKNPDATASQVAKATSSDIGYVYALRHSDKGKASKTPKQKWKMLHMSTSNEAMPFKEEAERIFELTKGRQRMHPVTGKMLMQGMPMKEDKVTMIEPQADNVNHPAHYKVGGIETIDFIEAKNLSYHLGNVVKYIARADSKGNREEDLLKARWYLNREIAKFGK
jgi:hypothetical protein